MHFFALVTPCCCYVKVAIEMIAREGNDREMSATHRSIRVTTSHEEDYQLHDEFGVANR